MSVRAEQKRKEALSERNTKEQAEKINSQAEKIKLLGQEVMTAEAVANERAEKYRTRPKN